MCAALKPLDVTKKSILNHRGDNDTITVPPKMGKMKDFPHYMCLPKCHANFSINTACESVIDCALQ